MGGMENETRVVERLYTTNDMARIFALSPAWVKRQARWHGFGSKHGAVWLFTDADVARFREIRNQPPAMVSGAAIGREFRVTRAWVDKLADKMGLQVQTGPDGSRGYSEPDAIALRRRISEMRRGSEQFPVSGNTLARELNVSRAEIVRAARATDSTVGNGFRFSTVGADRIRKWAERRKERA